MERLGALLLIGGIAVAALGALVLAVGHFSGWPSWVGRLPGDLYVRRGNWTVYFPLATSLLISILLTVIIWLVGRR